MSYPHFLLCINTDTVHTSLLLVLLCIHTDTVHTSLLLVLLCIHSDTVHTSLLLVLLCIYTDTVHTSLLLVRLCIHTDSPFVMRIEQSNCSKQRENWVNEIKIRRHQMLIFIKAKGNHEYKINAARITNAILVKMGPK